MASSHKSSDLYALAGIRDVAKFYRDKFSTGGVLDARYFDALDRFDVRYARTMWVYDNVRHNSSVLDLGCGEGLLGLLKRKGISLTGVDLSTDLLATARRNGYDVACVAQLTALPFPDSSFDYVTSLDVMGHIPFAEKNVVLGEIKRVLRPGGVTLHGIECLDTILYQDYDLMSEERLRRFINIDGHIGLEEDDEHAARFRRYFTHVQMEPRYSLCLSSEEFIKQADEYGVPFEADFIEYLRNLSCDARRAFDLAMGYVFGKISDLRIRLPKSGLYTFLKASEAPLGPFYNAHRDRRDILFSSRIGVIDGSQSFCLDRHSRADFDSGWYGANYLPPVARWMGERARVRFEAASLSKIRLDLATHMPDLRAQPLALEFRLNGACICAISLFDYGWLELEVYVPAAIVRAAEVNNIFVLEVSAGRTWQPSLASPGSKDDRQLSIAVCNIEVHPSKPHAGPLSKPLLTPDNPVTSDTCW